MSFYKPVEAITFDQLLDELKNPTTTLLDVRAPPEVKEDGKIHEAKNVPFGELPFFLGMNDRDFVSKFGFPKPRKNARIICHCKGGMRGQRFATALQDAGYTNVNVYPGIEDWKEHGGDIMYD